MTVTRFGDRFPVTLGPAVDAGTPLAGPVNGPSPYL